MILDIKDVSWPGWETVRTLGHGSFGAVYEIQRDVFGDTEKSALKVISIPQNDSEIEELFSDGFSAESVTKTYENYLQNIVSEYSIMRRLNGSTNVVHCDDVRYEKQPNGIGWNIYIKMELLTPMAKAISEEIAESQVIQIAKDMCAALKLCAKHNIIHRDIKPQNMFFSENGDCKLGDFGIAKTVSSTTRGTVIGTPKYIAPEVYKGQPYGVSADIYSLGLVLYWLLNERRTPFMPLPPAQLFAGMDGEANNRRLLGEPFPPPKNGSDELKRIVMKACAYNPKERYSSAAAMLQDLTDLENGLFAIVPPVVPAESESSGKFEVHLVPEPASEPTPDPIISEKAASAASADPVPPKKETAVHKPSDVAEKHSSPYDYAYTPARMQKKRRSFLVPFLIFLIILILLFSGAWVVKNVISSQNRKNAGAQEKAGNPSGSSGSVGKPSSNSSEANEEDVTTPPIRITFQSNGGTGADTPIDVQQNSTVGSLPTPTRPNYDFAGWYNQAEGGTQITADSIISGKEDFVLYAQWKPKSFTVSFQPGDGTSSTSTKTVTYGETFGSLPIPERDHYTFVGWYTQPNGGIKIIENSVADQSNNITLYAQWSQNTFTVHFQANGGTVSVSSMEAIPGTTLGVLPTPTREFYEFTGWYTSVDAGEQIFSDTVIDEEQDITLYARWEAITYTVFFDGNGGYVSTGSQTVTANGQFGTLPKPNRDYYDFVGWYTAASGGTEVTASTVFDRTANITLYAHWKEHSLSGWVKASSVPSGAQIVNRKWSYTKTTTKESTNTSMSGYTQVDSYWVQSDTGSTNYASFPSTFDQSHSLYKNFAKSAYTGYENTTSKRVVTNTWAGYIYWHWMYNVSYSNTTVRFISDRTGTFDKYGKTNSSSYYFGWFYAFTSSVNCQYLDNNYCCNRNQPSYYCHDILPSDKSRIGTPRFFRFEYYTSSYVDYYKMFVYQKTENLESYNKVTASGDISNVQEWVQYRAK